MYMILTSAHVGFLGGTGSLDEYLSRGPRKGLRQGQERARGQTPPRRARPTRTPRILRHAVVVGFLEARI